MMKKNVKNKVWNKTAYPGIFYRETVDKETGKVTDHYYCGWYSVNGQRFQVVFGSKNKHRWTPKKCADKLAEFRNNAKEGTKPRDFKEVQELEEAARQEERAAEEERKRLSITFGEVWENHYLPQTKKRKKPGTVKAEEQYYKNWIEPALADMPLIDITVKDIKKIQNKMEKQGRTPRTIQYVLSIIRQLYNKATKDDDIAFTGINPITKMEKEDKPQVDNESQRYLTESEIDLLFGLLKEASHDLYETALLSLHSGMRAGEIHNMQWKDLDFEKGIITIPQAKNTRGGSKVRYVFMTQQIKAMLEARKQNKICKWVFPDRNGSKRESVSKAYYRIMEKSGLNDGIKDSRFLANFHSLRHTFASWQIQNGMSLYQLRDLLGHRSLTMVSRYAHLAPDAAKEAVRIFDTPPEPDKEPDNEEENPKPENAKVLNFRKSITA